MCWRWTAFSSRSLPRGNPTLRSIPSEMKTVHLATANAKALYYDPERSALRPNLVFVGPDGSVSFEINELGLKGDPRDPHRKLAVVWGGSGVFSHGRGWACLLDRAPARH